MAQFEYAPAPESRAVVEHPAVLRPVHRRRVRRVRRADRRSRRSTPPTEEVLAEVTEASADDVDRAVAAARAAYERRLGPDVRRRPRQVPLPHRPHPAGAGPRVRRARDARQRQADQGDAATSTCRWRRRTSSTTRAGPTSSSTPASGTDPAPASASSGQVIPWNFPLLMLAWKIAPALAAGNTVVLKPAETTPLTRAALRRGLPAGRPARRVSSTSSPAPARPGRRLVDHPGVDKLAFTGSTERRQDDRPLDRRHPQEGHPRARRQGRQHRLRRRRRSTRPSRASSTASSSTRATSAAPGRGCWCRRTSPTRSYAGSSAGCRRCASATRWTRTPTSARSTPRAQLDRITRAHRRRRGRGRRALEPRRATLPSKGFWFRANGVHRRLARPTASPRRRSSGRSCRC